MPDTQLNARNAPEITRPSCSICGTRMWLLRISTTANKTEQRTFACPVCEVSQGQADKRY